MSIEFSARTRTQNIRTLKTTPLDVLVIGGGIVGAGLIRDLALNGGIKAGLIEQADFANGTSSASSQLIHGGFRYLIKGDFNLIKQARREREVLLHIAPNLVKPIPLAILRYKGDPYPLTGIHLAARYYNCLSKTTKAEKSIILRNAARIQTLVGPIETDKLKGCVILWDSTTDDARLTLATVKDAHRHGAVIANYVRFLHFAGNRISQIRYIVSWLKMLFLGTVFESQQHGKLFQQRDRGPTGSGAKTQVTTGCPDCCRKMQKGSICFCPVMLRAIPQGYMVW